MVNPVRGGQVKITLVVMINNYIQRVVLAASSQYVLLTFWGVGDADMAEGGPAKFHQTKLVA